MTPYNVKCKMAKCEAWKKEFKLYNFGLGYHRPSDFVTPQCGPRGLFFFWTGVWALYHLVNLFLEIYWQQRIEGYHDFGWLRFLTNWTYILLTLGALWDACCIIHVHTQRKDLLQIMLEDEVRYTPWYLNVDWLFYTTNSVAIVLVTAVFWAVLYDSNAYFNSYNKHAVNAAYVFLNLLYSAKPFRIFHAYMPVIYFGLYFIFSYIYYRVSGGLYIYPQLDWNDPGIAIRNSLPLVFGGVLVVHLCLFFVTKIRSNCAFKCCVNRVHTSYEKSRMKRPSARRAKKRVHYNDVRTPSATSKTSRMSSGAPKRPNGLDF